MGKTRSIVLRYIHAHVTRLEETVQRLVFAILGKWVTKCTVHTLPIFPRLENEHQHQKNKSHYTSKET